MNRQDERPSDALQRRVDALPRDLELGRDLWPVIAARLTPVEHTPRPRRVPWLPVAVALAAGYVLASVFPLPWLATTTPAGFEIVAPDPMLVDSVRPALEQLPAKTRSVVEANLSGLEHDRLTIEQALTADPDNALLQELRTNAQDRAESLVEQMSRLTRRGPPEDVGI